MSDETNNSAAGGQSDDEIRPQASGSGQNPQSDDGKNPRKQKYSVGTKGKFLVIPPHPDTTFDDAKFLTLLEGSLSLSIEEKVRVADAVPRLKQQQIDDLFRIFDEEKERFAELSKEAGDKVDELKQRREREIDMAQSEEAEDTESDDDAAEAERLRKDLGI